jgi:hypothetical protein
MNGEGITMREIPRYHSWNSVDQKPRRIGHTFMTEKQDTMEE